MVGVAPKTGLDGAQALRRTAQYGANQISPPPKRVLRKAIGWVFGGFGSLLMTASVLCFVSWYDILSRPPFFLNGILNGSYLISDFEPAGSRWGTRIHRYLVFPVVVVFQAAFNAWQDFSTSRVMDSIEGMIPADVVVLRDGVQTILPAASLVPRDIVHLNMGQKVPADVKLIDVSGNLRFDWSVLTGEVCYDTRIRSSPLPPLFSANDSRSHVERTDRRTLRQGE